MAGTDSPDTTEITQTGTGPQPFAIKDCALVALATGKKARQLQEFRAALATIDTASIYHHFWGGLLQARFEEREYNNDFAAWVRHGIHDAILTERLSALSPIDFPDLELLRQQMLDLIDARLDEVEHLLWSRATQQFEFVRSQIVVFDTELKLQQPAELPSQIMNLSISSVFYHFIDARRRTPDGRDDFSDWLSDCGAEFAPLCERLASIDPYFGNLSDLREQLAALFGSHFQQVSA